MVSLAATLKGRSAEPEPAPVGASLRDQAEALAQSLPALLVAAERVATTVSQGVHGRRRTGQGESFWQFRRYGAGDPAQSIDWRQSAKADPLYVREFEWEAAQTVWLWCDRSPSMYFRSSMAFATKVERAMLLTLALATLLARAGERTALLGEGLPATGRVALRRITEGFASRPRLAAPPPLDTRLPRHCHVVLMGDFLDDLEPLREGLRGLGARGVRGHVLQILDPAEETLPFTGRIRYEGLEQEGTLLVTRSEDLRDAYRKRLLAQRATLTHIARAAGFGFSLHHTDASAQTALLNLYAALGPLGPRR